MFKKVLLFLLISIISISIIGCSNNQTNEKSGTNSTNESEKSNSGTNNFDKYNILTFGEIEIDDSEDYEDDKYIDIKTKVTNNSSEVIKTITVNFSFYDDDNTIIDSTHPQEGSSIESKQSFYIDALYERDLNVKDIKINSYSYYIGDLYYEIDLISKTAEIYE